MISLLDFDLRPFAIGGLALVSSVLMAVVWHQDYTIGDLSAQVSALSADVATSVSANRQANSTISRLQRSAAATSDITVDWAQWSVPVQDSARSAAITIEGERNDSAMDSIMPVDIERILDRVREQACAASGSCPVSGGHSSAGAIFAGQDNSGAPGGETYSPKAGAMGGRPAGDARAQRGR